MSNKSYLKLLPVLMGSMGIACAMSRLGLFLLATDHKGLLIPGHPLSIIGWVLTAIAVAMAAAMAWILKGPNHYCSNFRPSCAAAIGCFAMAGGITVAVVSRWGSPMLLERICTLMALLSIPALIAAGLLRFMGKKPFFLFFAPVCMYLTFYTITHYQVWSSQPQLQDWFFSMAGITALNLFSYYQTAFCVEMGNRRMQMLTGLLAGFFCLASMTEGADIPLHIGGAFWALTNLCTLTPAKHTGSSPAADGGKE